MSRQADEAFAAKMRERAQLRDAMLATERGRLATVLSRAKEVAARIAETETNRDRAAGRIRQIRLEELI